MSNYNNIAENIDDIGEASHKNGIVIVHASPFLDTEDGKFKPRKHYRAECQVQLGSIRDLMQFVKQLGHKRPEGYYTLTKAQKKPFKDALPYFFWPLKSGGGDEKTAANQRKNASVTGANWFTFDFDGLSQDAFEALTGFDFIGNGLSVGGALANYRAFAYTTASDIPDTDDRRLRVVFEAAEVIQPADKARVAMALEWQIMTAIGAQHCPDEGGPEESIWQQGGKKITLDRTVYRPAQVNYTTFDDAPMFCFDDVPALELANLPALDTLPPEYQRKSRTFKDDAEYTPPADILAAIDADPRAQWLLENGHVTGDNGKNVLFIRCPHWMTHSDADSRDYDHGDSGTAYMLDDNEALRRFACQHSSCADAIAYQAEYCRAMGMPDALCIEDIRVASVDDFEDLPPANDDDAGAGVDSGVPFLSGVSKRHITADERSRLGDLNREFVHTTAGGKNVVCQIVRRNIGGVAVQQLQFMKPEEMYGRFTDADPVYGFTRATDKEGNEIKKRGNALNLARAWQAWPSHAKKFGGVDFYPNPKQCPRDVYNLFTGFNVEPHAGNVEPYIRLVEDIICGGNKGHAAYVLDFLAHMFQRPEQKPTVAIVMRGGRGTGKGSFMKPIGRILGMHFAHLTGAGQAAGRFNAVLIGKLAIFIDEMHVTTRDAEDALKTIISEPVISMERKGIDPEPISNNARIIGASNHADAIRTGENERRYMFLEPSNAKAQDATYWKPYHAWADSEQGPSALLAFLLKRDISNFDPYNAPRTDALMSEMVSDLSPVNRFVLEQLRLNAPFGIVAPGDEDAADLAVELNGELRDADKPMSTGSVKTEYIAKLYRPWLDAEYPKRYGTWTIDAARNHLSRVFNEVFYISAEGRKGAGYGRRYVIDDVEACRRMFAEHIGVTYAAAFGEQTH